MTLPMCSNSSHLFLTGYVVWPKTGWASTNALCHPCPAVPSVLLKTGRSIACPLATYAPKTVWNNRISLQKWFQPVVWVRLWPKEKKKFLMWVFLLLFSCSASGCPLASKNKALREQLSGNIKYGNGSSTTFGNRLAALSSSGNTYDPESLTQEKTSPTNDINDEKVRSKK